MDYFIIDFPLMTKDIPNRKKRTFATKKTER